MLAPAVIQPSSLLALCAGLVPSALNHLPSQPRVICSNQRAEAALLRPITVSANLSISSNCGLHCNKTKSTPAASKAATRSATCSAVPTNPDRNPRFETE